ncbi:probable splicing factor, arginine/serine-rich 5 [Octopus sinensis]|uniref:Probable splicing factor, arginine/serine-rich 5 n=1 Tax=Octopus sinensis TaxID=2607531 RepID=A0A6P7U2Z8_9MOLL|nr:probable splicing factor, arginine/serine-rich 5 [Octopus sinensis]
MSYRNDARLYVGNLPADIRESEIENIFRKYGRVVHVDLKQPRNGRGLPFAFVEMDHRHAADDAVHRRNGYSVDGYRIRVEFPKGSYSRSSNRTSSFVPRRSKNSVIVSVVSSIKRIARIDRKLSKNKKTIPAILHNTKDYIEKITPNTVKLSEIDSFTESLKKFKLKKPEVLMIINLMPRSEVELYTIIEMIESRFSNDEIQDMIQLIISALER